MKIQHIDRFTFETIFHEETKINQLSQVIRTNFSKRPVMIEEISSRKTTKWSPGTERSQQALATRQDLDKLK